MSYRPTRFHVVLLLLTLALLYAMATGFVVYYQVSYALILALIGTFVWGRVGLWGLDVRVQRRLGYREVGGTFVSQISVTNTAGPKPLLVVQEENSFPGPNGGRVINLSTHTTEMWANRIVAARRGDYTIGPITVTSSDPFGIFRHNREYGTVQQVVVYPATVPLPLFSLPRRGSPGEGERRSPFASTSPMVSTVREYLPTDTFGRIHWPTTARTGQLMVKQFEQDTGSDVWLVLDLHRNVQAGEGDESTEEYGVTIAASMAHRLLDAGMSVGLFAHGREPVYELPGRGYAHQDRILRALATARATGGVPLESVLEEGRRLGLDQSTMIIITPSVDPRWPEAASWLFRHGSQVSTVLLDPASFGGLGEIQAVADRLATGGVRTFAVRQGDSLPQALARPLYMPSWQLASSSRAEVTA
ncbi:MAG: DUF58 domain-containing protein [Chloroflexota bacterium]|nr:DUF58 domain-containing protein [Chloroflexota bacterium]MDE2970437.1 DUF58 domain-containing protein [Chloroflexota bacterium]